MLRSLVLVMMVLTLGAYGLTLRTPTPNDDEVPPSATMDVLFDGPDLFVDFDVPAMLLLGFDHTPTNSTEHNALLSAHRLLDSGQMIEPPPGARCTLSESYATVGHGYDDLCSAGSALLDTDKPGKSGRQESPARWLASPVSEPGAPTVVAARWSWFCKQPLQLDELNVRLLNEFERLKQLSVSVDGQHGQQSLVLDPDNTHLDLKTELPPRT